MIKRLILFLSIAAIVTSGIIFYWPQSFTKVIDENAGVYIIYTERLFNERGTPILDSIKTEIFIEPESEQFTELMEILGGYSYHRSLQTYFGDPIIKGGGNERIMIDAYPDSISNIGTKEIIIGSKVYHLGYWGNKKAQAMIRDIKAYVQGKNL